MIIVCRKKMLTLSQSILSDMAPVHSNIKINEKYYNITSSYGRIEISILNRSDAKFH